MNRRTPIATALLALFASPAVWSQQAAPASNSASQPASTSVAAAGTTLPEVTVTGTRDSFQGAPSMTKLAPDLRDVPQSVIVVNKALLQSQGATSLSDALRNVPGVTLGGAEGGQIGNNINLNGFTARTDIYLDGFRDRGQYYRDTFALDSVEVLMGPSSMLFGRGSTGGVINQVSKRPSLKESTDATASVTTTGMVRTTIDHNAPLTDAAAFRISAMAQDGKPTTRDVMKNKDYGIAPSLKFGIGTPTEITMSALLQHNRDMPDYGVSPLDGAPVKVDRNTFYGFTDDRTIQDVGALSALIDHKISPTMSIRNQTQYNDVRVNAVETASQTIGVASASGFAPLASAGISNGQSLDQLSVRLQSHDRVIHDKSLFNQTEFNARLDAGGMKHNLLVGGELGRDTYSNQAYFRAGNCNGQPLQTPPSSGYIACEHVLDPAYTESPVVTRNTGNLSTSTANSIAAYVNDSIEFNPQWKAVAGLRYDNFQAKVNNSIATTTAPARIDQTVNFTSVRLGGIWQPTVSQSYYLSYSTSFNPSLEQLTNTTGATAPLAPEKNKSYELGGKWDPIQGKLSLDAAIFQITKDNARSQPDTNGQFEAIGTIRVKGARLGASGLILPKWKVFAAYAYLDAEILSQIAPLASGVTQGMVPGNTPKHSGSIWSTYEFAPHWELGGGATAMSTRFLNNTDTVSVPKYVRFDATLAYRQKDYDIRLNLFNLTDKFYYDALIQSDGGRAVPGTGRSAMLSFSYHI
jgi:catecholate siderophore receptor